MYGGSRRRSPRNFFCNFRCLFVDLRVSRAKIPRKFYNFPCLRIFVNRLIFVKFPKGDVLFSEPIDGVWRGGRFYTRTVGTSGNVILIENIFNSFNGTWVENQQKAGCSFCKSKFNYCHLAWLIHQQTFHPQLCWGVWWRGNGENNSWTARIWSDRSYRNHIRIHIIIKI